MYVEYPWFPSDLQRSMGKVDDKCMVDHKVLSWGHKVLDLIEHSVRDPVLASFSTKSNLK